MKIEISHLEGFTEIREKLILCEIGRLSQEELVPLLRRAGLDPIEGAAKWSPEQQLLALTDEVLCGLASDYIATLSPEAQAEIQRRLNHLESRRADMARALTRKSIVTLSPEQKTLSTIGNSLGLIIERPILDLLNIDKDTKLAISTDGESLIIRPVRDTQKARVDSAAERLMDQHEDTFGKLAK